MKNLSKSKLLAYEQCAKRLWLEVHKPKQKVISAQTQTVFDIGHRVGDLARQLYDVADEGTLINPFSEGWPSAFRRTTTLLKGDQPVFEATFAAGGVLAMADVMLRGEQGGWDMLEVKSSTKVKDYHHLDVSVQMYVAHAAGVKLNKIALACIDSSWIYSGDGDYRGLLYETDLTAEARDRQTDIAQLVSAAQAVANTNKEPDIAIGPHCSEPFECSFYSYCTRNISKPEYPVSWLPRVTNAELRNFILENNIVDMVGVPDRLLNAQQLRVKQATLAGETYFNATAARKALPSDTLPAYFVDFETFNPAIPIWAGTRPYQQLPYQFSNHIVDADGGLTHREFLDLSGDDPRREFAMELIRTCGETGPIYVYNIGFERGIVAQLATLFEDLADSLNRIIERLVDLLPIARDNYYHPNQQGSWSIKKVLPTIAPELSYEDLQGVQDGMAAMQVFEEAINPQTTPERKVQIEQQLLKYCALDTYAMVAIWRFFAGM